MKSHILALALWIVSSSKIFKLIHVSFLSFLQPNEALELRMFTEVRNLEEAYHMSVASEDYFKSLNFCRIYTEFAEALLTKMLDASTPQQPHYALQVFELVLACCGHPGGFSLFFRSQQLQCPGQGMAGHGTVSQLTVRLTKASNRSLLHGHFLSWAPYHSFCQ